MSSLNISTNPTSNGIDLNAVQSFDMQSNEPIFVTKIPNEETLETMAKTDRGEELTTYKNSADMFDKLGI